MCILDLKPILSISRIAINTSNVTVSGTDPMHYMVDIPPQIENTFNSFYCM